MVSTGIRERARNSCKLEIRIDDFVFTASMLEDKAPKTCKALIDLLPLEGEVLHATWSGDMIFHKSKKLPAELEQENRTVYPSQGDVALNSDLRELQIVYGQAQLRARFGPAPDNVFAKITQNLKNLEEIGKKIHREGAKKIFVRLSP